MNHLQGAVETLSQGLSDGLKGVGMGHVGDQLKSYLDKYSQDSNGLIMVVVGLLVVYFLMKMLMPMLQSSIVVIVIALVGWIMFQKWSGGSGGSGGVV